MADICIIGTGYVWLSCGACLNSIGHYVGCKDNDHTNVEMLNSGRFPIVEEGLVEKMKFLKVIGCRNTLDKGGWLDAGFSHQGIGR